MDQLSQIRALYAAGNRREAARLVRRAVRTQPSRALLHAWGLVELSLGNHSAASLAFERALAEGAGPTSAVYNDRGACLAKLGRWGEAVESFARVGPDDAVFAKAAANRGAALLRLGEAQAARAAFLSSLECEPLPSTGLGLVRALTALGRRGEAESLIGRIFQSKAVPFEALDALLELRLGTSESRDKRARALRAQSEQHSGIRALARRAGAEVAPAAAAADFEAYRKMCQVTEVRDFARDQAAKWAGLIRRLPSMTRAPTDHATVGGLHSGDLFSDPDFDLSELHTEIARLVTGFVRRAATMDGPTPYRSAPDGVVIHAWAVHLEKGQYQEIHFHPEAWLSGCTYLEVPEGLGEGDAGGELYFQHPRGHAAERVVPQVGKAVVFPSCLDHGTRPQVSVSPRLSVAFDVIPIATLPHVQSAQRALR